MAPAPEHLPPPPQDPAGIGAAPPTPRLPVGDVTREAFGPGPGPVAPPGLPRWRRILGIAWPVVLTNLFQSLALTVDLIFVGALGAGALAAAGLATQVFWLTTAVATGLAAAATALVARAIGAGDPDRVADATWHVVLASFAIGLPLTVAVVGLAPLLVLVAGGAPDIAAPASSFLVLLGASLTAEILVTALSGASNGAGDTRIPLLVGVVINVVNLVLDYLLIFGNLGFPALGLRGAAIATSISFVTGAILILVVAVRGRRPIRVAVSRPSWARFRSLLRIGGPAGAEALLLSLGFTAYLLLILHFGAAALAAHQIGLRVQSFAFMPGFGLAAAAAALVGQGLGAGDPTRADADGWGATRLALVVMMAGSIPLVLLAEPLAGLFTRDPDALRLGTLWIRAIVLAMPAIAVHFTVAGALRGAGDTRFPLLVSFAGLWIVRLPLAWLLAFPAGWGMLGIWAAYVVEYYARAGATAWRFHRGRWKTVTV